MVTVIVRHPQHKPIGTRVGTISIAAPELDHSLIADTVGEVHVEQARVGVVRREGQRQQSLLVGRPHAAPNVQKRLTLHLTVLDHANSSAPLDDHHPRGVVGRRGHMYGHLKRTDADQAHAAGGLLRHARRGSARVQRRVRRGLGAAANDDGRSENEDAAQPAVCHGTYSYQSRGGRECLRRWT